jgi:hypothetical protein
MNEINVNVNSTNNSQSEIDITPDPYSYREYQGDKDRDIGDVLFDMSRIYTDDIDVKTGSVERETEENIIEALDTDNTVK